MKLGFVPIFTALLALAGAALAIGAFKTGVASRYKLHSFERTRGEVVRHATVWDNESASEVYRLGCASRWPFRGPNPFPGSNR